MDALVTLHRLSGIIMLTVCIAVPVLPGLAVFRLTKSSAVFCSVVFLQFCAINGVQLNLKTKICSLGSFPWNKSPQAISAKNSTSSTVMR